MKDATTDDTQQKVARLLRHLDDLRIDAEKCAAAEKGCEFYRGRAQAFGHAADMVRVVFEK